ncbi:MAG: GNAT family N-acetyltransferase [Candidatus Heimdallarchaeota archaeon]|nr:GNAT family N-acetyltransferase [Candidatus Heimdallarchaeota archaeon]
MRIPYIFPVLRTERLVLRAIKEEDREAMYSIFSDPDVAKWFMDEILTDITQVDPFITHFKQYFRECKGITWAIEFEGEYIGSCGYESISTEGTGDIGFDLSRQHWRKGLMTEALQAMIEYGNNDLQLSQITAHTAKENEAAQQILLKLGFKFLKDDDHGVHYHLIEQ